MSVRELRRSGWRQAIRKAGLIVDESLLATGRMTVDSRCEKPIELFDLAEPPTAIFADNLVMATEIPRALRDRKLRCPRDLEVVSPDDAEWLDMSSPPITTIV